MTTPRNRFLLATGWLLIAIGILGNPWLLAALLTSTGIIKSFSSIVIIWIFELFCLGLGLIFIKGQHYLRKYHKEILLSFLSIIFCLIMLDFGTRFFHFFKNTLTGRDAIYSEYLGWENTTNIHSKRVAKGFGQITYSTNQYGFRVFGDLETPKTRIFAVGDSYTAAHGVSNGSTYYDYLKQHDDRVEIFACGVGGYGSLQEYLLLDKYFSMIKPDIILWQFCSNDLVNNDIDLESVSYLSNDHMVRPYLKDGKIVRMYPKRKYDIFNLGQHFYLGRLVDIKLGTLMNKLYGSIEVKFDQNPQLLTPAIKITSDTMALVHQLAGKIPVVAFEVDHPSWIKDIYPEVCAQNGIYFIPGIPAAVERARLAGEVVNGYPYDDHWNKNGHAIAGKMILDYLLKNNFLKTN